MNPFAQKCGFGLGDRNICPPLRPFAKEHEEVDDTLVAKAYQVFHMLANAQEPADQALYNDFINSFNDDYPNHLNYISVVVANPQSTDLAGVGQIAANDDIIGGGFNADQWKEYFQEKCQAYVESKCPIIRS